MKRASRGFLGTLCLWMLWAGGAAAQKPVHPLDDLTTSEYWQVNDIVRASGKADVETEFVSILLREPEKAKVLAWKPGEPFAREADVVLQRKGVVIEARVDLAAGKLESWKALPGKFAGFSDNAVFETSPYIKADPRVQAALAKRGYTDLSQVECMAIPIGFMAYPEQADHRIGLADCAYTHGVFHTWGRYIGGLQVEVDFAEKKVLRVTDDGVVPMPTGPTNFEQAPEIARPGTTRVELLQPNGPGFQIKGGEVSWQNWKFRFRLDTRLGTILNLVKIEDGGKSREVMYEGSMSELWVPYMDVARGWDTRMFIDAGEFYPGGVLRSLMQGIDCPSNAVFFDGLSTDDKGSPIVRPRQACLFESFPGEVAWRHGDGDLAWGRPAKRLVLRTAAVIGNYDYLMDWRFEQDGTLRAAVGATGIIETRPVAEATVDGMAGHEGVETYGHLVAKNLLGVNHDHFFSYRFDLDVDGQANTLMVHRLVNKKMPAGSLRKSIWVNEPFEPKTESEAMLDIRLDKPSMWLVVNPNVKGPLGHPTGFEIMPGATAASIVDPEDPAQKAGAFAEHQLWVTPYNRDELYAGGTYPVSSRGDDGLAIWTKQNRGIANTDIVAWYTMGFHHVPREEDWPVMPTMWHEVALRPFDFYPENPVMDLPKVP